ncbi:MAG TPA: transcriptional repressor LexA [Acidobacteriota bacterium]|nr:transcriptional repressor LexA [Acidobacteriota bacterium]
MKEKLTDRQRAIFEHIRDQIVRRGQPPTIREIGEAFAIRSTNGVRAHLSALIRKGYIKKEEYISRGIELTREFARDIVRVPLVGSVPAGVPIDAVENVESEFALDQSFLPRGEIFSLKVTGDSMKNAGILDGDVVVVKKQPTAQRGNIIVAVMNGEATVKRFFPQAKKIRLQPENDDFQPIIVSRRTGDFKIVGRVVGLLRRIR